MPLSRRYMRCAVRIGGRVRRVCHRNVIGETALVIDSGWKVVGDANLVVHNIPDMMRSRWEVYPHRPDVIRPRAGAITRNMSKKGDSCGEVAHSFSIGCRPFQLSSLARMRITFFPPPVQVIFTGISSFL